MSKRESSSSRQEDSTRKSPSTKDCSQMRSATARPIPSAGNSSQNTPTMTITGTNSRQPSNGLRLAPIPKYHPALYRSPASSNTGTPAGSRPSSSRGLLSPRATSRQFSEAQKSQQDYQRQMIAALRQSTGMTGIPATNTPSAPHLHPRDSPGPTTPLNLEEGGDYLTARSIGEGSPRALAEKLVREEQERRNGMRADRPSPAISPRC